MEENLVWTVVGISVLAIVAYVGVIIWATKRFFDFIDKQGL